MRINDGLDIGQYSASIVEDISYDPADSRSQLALEIDQLPALPVPLNSLGPGFFLRQSGTDAAHVQLLADASNSGKLPPILVQKHSLRIVDGMHRIEAAKLRGQRSINARFIDCTDEEAFILAVKSNTLHGLPLSRADRISGAKRILAWHRDWSDRAVAAATGLSAKTIAGLRHRSADEVADGSKRLGRDGKRRPVTGLEGRKRAAEYLAARPDAPLREVAMETDVSLGTVHDVRARLRRGADPLANLRESSARQDQDGAGTQQAVTREDAGQGGPVQHQNGFSLHGRREHDPSPTWPSISSKIANDPTIRYTEGGRTFLRWMTSHIVHPDEWDGFIVAIPPHWAGDVSQVAEKVSDAWRDFADQLRTRQGSAALNGQ